MALVISFLFVGMMPVDVEARLNIFKRKMTIEQVHQGIREGMTREEVEDYFSRRNIKWSFMTKDEVDKYIVPKFVWKSPNAIGLYGTTIQDNKFTWLGYWFFPEYLSIRVEIDVDGKVSQVVAEYGYTGP